MMNPPPLPYVVLPIPETGLAKDEALLAEVLARGEGIPTKANSGLWLIMAGLFVTLGGLNWGWESLIFTGVAIALHEIGHVIAMRFFGYKNVRMLFIPLFGGLATGQPSEQDAAKNALVALAGPLFGLLTTAVAAGLAYGLDSPSWLVKFTWVSLILNVFNLIPVVPLDGGRVANELVFARYPVLELLFKMFAIAALGWLAWYDGVWVLGALAFFMIFTTPAHYRRARMIRKARRDPLWQNRTLDLETVVTLREMVTKLFHTIHPSHYEKAMPDHVHGFWLDIHKRFPGFGRSVVLLSAYLFTFVILAPALGFLMLRFLQRPQF